MLTTIYIFSLVMLGVSSLVNIYAEWIEDGLVGRIIYMITAIVCLSGILAVESHGPQTNILVTVALLCGLKSVRNATVATYNHLKYKDRRNEKR